MIIPGFANRYFGFLLIFPITRKLLFKKFSKKFNNETKIKKPYIEGEFEDLERMMSENYKIMSKFIKDISGETPDIETYYYAKDYISKYQLNIEINSRPLKKQIIEVNTMLKFHDTAKAKKKLILK